jgi:mono/diheme cytochrome c family protein
MRVLLSLAAAAALILLAAACGSAHSAATTGTASAALVPAGDLTGHAAAGRIVYAGQCASCHGSLGQGKIASDFRRDANARDFQRTVIRVWYGAQGMTPFGHRLQNQQIADVAAYVNQLAGAS